LIWGSFEKAAGAWCSGGGGGGRQAGKAPKGKWWERGLGARAAAIDGCEGASGMWDPAGGGAEEEGVVGCHRVSVT